MASGSRTFKVSLELALTILDLHFFASHWKCFEYNGWGPITILQWLRRGYTITIDFQVHSRYTQYAFLHSHPMLHFASHSFYTYFDSGATPWCWTVSQGFPWELCWAICCDRRKVKEVGLSTSPKTLRELGEWADTCKIWRPVWANAMNLQW